MMDSEDIAFLRSEIKRQVQIILFGAAGTNTEQAEDIVEMVPGMPTITERPVMHPYGLVSRAPEGTISVAARCGDHAGNRMVIGHRDKNRPAVGTGETYLYNEFGQMLQLKNGTVQLMQSASQMLQITAALAKLVSTKVSLVAPKVTLGSEGAADPVALGTELESVLSSLAGLVGSLASQCAGIPGLSPPQILAFTAIATQAGGLPISSILSTKVFTE